MIRSINLIYMRVATNPLLFLLFYLSISSLPCTLIHLLSSLHSNVMCFPSLAISIASTQPETLTHSRHPSEPHDLHLIIFNSHSILSKPTWAIHLQLKNTIQTLLAQIHLNGHSNPNIVQSQLLPQLQDHPKEFQFHSIPILQHRKIFDDLSLVQFAIDLPTLPPLLQLLELDLIRILYLQVIQLKLLD